VSQPIIHVQDLHKEFVLRHTGVGSLKTLLLWRQYRHMEQLHVLRGVSFDV